MCGGGSYIPANERRPRIVLPKLLNWPVQELGNLDTDRDGRARDTRLPLGDRAVVKIELRRQRGLGKAAKPPNTAEGTAQIVTSLR